MSSLPRASYRCCLLVLGGIALVTPMLVTRVDAEPPEAAGDVDTVTEIDQLVLSLGNDEFAARERATGELIKLGVRSVDALRKGVKNPDREIRYRSERILAILERIDFEQRLAAFAAGDKGAEDALPGWRQYRDLVGGDDAARELFVEMQKSEYDLLKAIENGPKSVAGVITNRTQQIQEIMRFNRGKNPVSLGTIVSLLFAAVNEEVSVPPLAAQLISNYLYQTTFSTAINTPGAKQTILRKLIGKWILRSDDVNTHQTMMLAIRYGAPEGLVPAEKALRLGAQQINQANTAYVRQYALITVARFGEKKHLKLVKPLLNDKTPYGGTQRVGKVTYRSQIRDVALATAVRLTGEDYKKFGFDRMQKHSTYVFNTSTLAFADDTKREAAIAKWRKEHDAE